MRRIFEYLQSYKAGGGRFRYTETGGQQCVVFEMADAEIGPIPIMELAFNSDVGFFIKSLHPGEVDEAAGYDDTAEA